MSLPEAKRVPFSVSPNLVKYFEQNYPIHHAVLLELVNKGDAKISDDTEAKH